MHVFTHGLMMKKEQLYRVVDAGSGAVFVEHIEKEGTSMGYIILLKKLFKKYEKPRLFCHG